jgi:hypothetical protein
MLVSQFGPEGDIRCLDTVLLHGPNIRGLSRHRWSPTAPSRQCPGPAIQPRAWTGLEARPSPWRQLNRDGHGDTRRSV